MNAEIFYHDTLSEAEAQALLKRAKVRVYILTFATIIFIALWGWIVATGDLAPLTPTPLITAVIATVIATISCAFVIFGFSSIDSALKKLKRLKDDLTPLAAKNILELWSYVEELPSPTRESTKGMLRYALNSGNTLRKRDLILVQKLLDEHRDAEIEAQAKSLTERMKRTTS